MIRVVLIVTAISACGRIDFSSVALDDGNTSTDDGPHDGNVAALPPSCVATMPECRAGVSCCDSPFVPAASYFRSYDVANDGMYAAMTYPATVSKIRLDRFEVTVGRFRAFLDAGQGTSAKPPATGTGGRALNGTTGVFAWEAAWNASLLANRAALDAALNCSALSTWTPAPGANENRALNCVSWYEAQAFCLWDGGFLPTEAEWNNAAAGGSQHRALPWSSPAGSLAIDASRAIYSTSAIADVGRVPAGDGAFGHADLAGNVWEWALDNYASPYSIASCDDCALYDGGLPRSFRGGGFQDAVNELRTGVRNVDNADLRWWYVGARCARPL